MDGTLRNLNRTEYDRFLNNTEEGINSITELEYDTIEETGFVNVTKFSTSTIEKLETKFVYDLRNGSYPFNNPRNKKDKKIKMVLF